MLPRPLRLRSGAEIATVRRQGSRARTGDLLVTVRSRGGDSPPRACVVVSKHSGGAVVRNRQRRRLQHALPPLLATAPVGTDVVVRGGPAVGALTHPELTRAFEATFAQALRRARPRA